MLLTSVRIIRIKYSYHDLPPIVPFFVKEYTYMKLLNGLIIRSNVYVLGHGDLRELRARLKEKKLRNVLVIQIEIIIY